MRLTGRRLGLFLDHLAAQGNVTFAGRSAGVSRTRVYGHRKLDPDFAARWEEAEQIAADRLEQEAWRRAVDGCPEPLVSAGRLVCGEDGRPLFVRRYSDPLLALLLKAHRPEKYSDRIDHKLSGTLTLAVLVEQAHNLIDAAKTIEYETEKVSAIEEVEQPSILPDTDRSHT
jgi:hypothetical protein